jgi:hypothetical protein
MPIVVLAVVVIPVAATLAVIPVVAVKVVAKAVKNNHF